MVTRTTLLSKLSHGNIYSRVVDQLGASWFLTGISVDQCALFPMTV